MGVLGVVSTALVLVIATRINEFAAGVIEAVVKLVPSVVSPPVVRLVIVIAILDHAERKLRCFQESQIPAGDS